jgi:ubiquinone/menaquinone biosynthesis C-methylase UbiE
MSSLSKTNMRASRTAARTPPAFFDQWSNTYDSKQLQALTYRPIHDAMLRRLRGSTLAVILDLGCGTGQFLGPLETKFPDATVIGVDLSEGMLAKAADRLAGGGSGAACSALVRSDAQFLPFATDSIDVITCSESFHWYPDQRATLTELARVLRPDGQLLLASIAATTDLGDATMRRFSRAAGQPFRALTPRRLAGLLEAAGFEITEQRRVPRLGLIPWPALTVARRL